LKTNRGEKQVRVEIAVDRPSVALLLTRARLKQVLTIISSTRSSYAVGGLVTIRLCLKGRSFFARGGRHGGAGHPARRTCGGCSSSSSAGCGAARARRLHGLGGRLHSASSRPRRHGRPQPRGLAACFTPVLHAGRKGIFRRSQTGRDSQASAGQSVLVVRGQWQARRALIREDTHQCWDIGANGHKRRQAWSAPRGDFDRITLDLLSRT